MRCRTKHGSWARNNNHVFKINPLLYSLSIQIEGAFMQGYGLFALEHHRYSPDGILLTNGPHAYKIPCFMDIPSEFNITLLRNSKAEKAVYSSKVIVVAV